jgi:hypothetical protein
MQHQVPSPQPAPSSAAARKQHAAASPSTTRLEQRLIGRSKYKRHPDVPNVSHLTAAHDQSLPAAAAKPVQAAGSICNVVTLTVALLFRQLTLFILITTVQDVQCSAREIKPDFP